MGDAVAVRVGGSGGAAVSTDVDADDVDEDSVPGAASTVVTTAVASNEDDDEDRGGVRAASAVVIVAAGKGDDNNVEDDDAERDAVLAVSAAATAVPVMSDAPCSVSTPTITENGCCSCCPSCICGSVPDVMEASAIAAVEEKMDITST